MGALYAHYPFCEFATANYTSLRNLFELADGMIRIFLLYPVFIECHIYCTENAGSVSYWPLLSFVFAVVWTTDSFGVLSDVRR